MVTYGECTDYPVRTGLTRGIRRLSQVYSAIQRAITSFCIDRDSSRLSGSNSARVREKVNKTLALAVAFLASVLMPAVSPAQEVPCALKNPCGKPTAWQDFNAFTLNVSSPERPDVSSWRGQFAPDTHDIQIDVDATDGKKSMKGHILMIDGRVMATQGLELEPGYEIDALDGPVLYLNLVVRLLGEALPNGPAEIHGIRSIDHSNKKSGIKFATPSASGFIAPPWRVKGIVKAIAPDVIEYRLALDSGTKGKRQDGGGKFVANFNGRLSKLASASLKDDMSLDGWTLYGVGPQTKKDGESTIYDYGAAPAPEQYKTVADVRRKLAIEAFPGEPDPSKDFTGFWKEKCEQAFGLQIMHFGTAGKYSITFCGPGGCGDPAEGRHTHITGDKHFVVMSEDEIKEKSSNGWDTYHRCTKDTHPVLKY